MVATGFILCRRRKIKSPHLKEMEGTAPEEGIQRRVQCKECGVKEGRKNGKEK